MKGILPMGRSYSSSLPFLSFNVLTLERISIMHTQLFSVLLTICWYECKVLYKGLVWEGTTYIFIYSFENVRSLSYVHNDLLF